MADVNVLRPPATGRRLTHGLTLLLATACGLIVANLYYAQPLLPALARSFQVSADVAGLTVVFAQLGYAAGLVFVVSLGDLMSSRPLIVGLLGANTVGLVLATLAPTPWMLIAALTVVGVSASAISLIIVLATGLAARDAAGGVVGTLMAGLLTGGLLARTVAGIVDELVGWRAVYGGSSVLIAVLTIILRVRLPLVPVVASTSYPRLLASVATLIRREGVLRRRMALGLLAFACTQLLWSALPLLLARSPYFYSSARIGLFGLLGAAGALVAHGIGRLDDRGLAQRATGVLILLIALSWVVLGAGGPILAVLIGIALSNAATQGLHVLNQARLFRSPASTRSRVTTAYMTAYFLGGTVGGGIAAPVFAAGGWLAITATGVGLCALGGAAWLADRKTSELTEEKR